ncbi:unnamed protein product [Nezara viridula]|uniref:Uncharacterized protein n=1 Tax=Nezara viridula TaxID=85310 RepID=A0A9P0HT16_NEZVI|nr:unnamed protein product [Nezara viridula]
MICPSHLYVTDGVGSMVQNKKQNLYRLCFGENGRSPPLYSLRNNTLVCVHGLLMYDPASEQDATMFTAVTDEEWNALIGFFYVDLEISVTYGASEFEIIETSPSKEEECWGRLEEEEEPPQVNGVPMQIPANCLRLMMFHQHSEMFLLPPALLIQLSPPLSSHLLYIVLQSALF